MMTDSLKNYTLKALHESLKKRDFSSVELTQFFLNRIKQYNNLNAYISVDENYALHQAKKADLLLAKNQGTLLTGIPITQKDIFCVTGLKTTCASKMLENFVAPYDATLIEKFNEAGAVLLGKANMDEFAMGSGNENSYFGPCKNPWDLTRVPGGSSGGSAAAVAARLTPAATGTDTGGSIRQPASLCGITGLKPTYGRISRYGMIAFASSFDTPGPLAKTAEDCAILLQTMAGHDVKDSTASTHPVPDYLSTIKNSIMGKKIGLPIEYFNAHCDKEIADALENTKKIYAELGAEFVDVSLPHFELGMSAYYILAPAECASNLARFDGVRYGYRCENPKDLNDLYSRSRSEGFGDEVKRRILIGTFVLSSGYIDAYYRQAQRIRRLIRDDFQHAFKKADLLLTPATPSPAFQLGQIIEPSIAYSQDIFTVGINLAGLPGIVFPIGEKSGLPFGAQLIGNYFSEDILLNMAHLFQQQTDWHTRSPEGF